MNNSIIECSSISQNAFNIKLFYEYLGIAVVCRRYDWKIELQKSEIETLRNEAKKLNLKPVTAVIKFPEKEIRFYTLDLKEYSTSLKELLKGTKNSEK